MVAALVNGVQGGKWYSLVDKAIRPSSLEAAWAKVRRNGGSAGVDGQSIARFAAHADLYLAELHAALVADAYRPLPVKRVEIPKDDGKKRPLGIPAVKDRVVQTALKMALEPVFEVGFRPGSYGFRPGRGAKDALREVARLLGEGFTHVVDADLKSYFDTIPHDRLMALVEDKISDGRMLKLIEGYLRQDVMKGMERWTPASGTPQGAVISPLLANIYLDPLDRLMEECGYRMIRYADDFVILCASPKEAAAALRTVEAWVADNGLTLHPDKTRVGDCRVAGQGFDFLGYRFEAGHRFVRNKSQRAIRNKLRALTGRQQGLAIGAIIAKLNPVLKGWFGYFKHAAPSEHRALDGFLRRRLRAILRRQEKRQGFGRCRNDHQRWPTAFFVNLGLITLATARHHAKDPR